MSEDFFPTYTAIQREDLKNLGYDADALTDFQMKVFARRMGEVYRQYMFVWDMRLVAWKMQVPRLKSNTLTKS